MTPLLTSTPEGRAAFLEALLAKRTAEKEAKREAVRDRKRDQMFARYQADPEAHRRYKRERRQRDPAALQSERAVCSAWRKKYPDTERNGQLKKKFGITLAQRDEMLRAQGGRCAVCGTDTPGRRDWDTDHCHSSGAVRGILCSPCNKGLGHFKEDIEALKAAINYLEKHSA